MLYHLQIVFAKFGNCILFWGGTKDLQRDHLNILFRFDISSKAGNTLHVFRPDNVRQIILQASNTAFKKHDDGQGRFQRKKYFNH